MEICENPLCWGYNHQTEESKISWIPLMRFTHKPFESIFFLQYSVCHIEKHFQSMKGCLPFHNRHQNPSGSVYFIQQSAFLYSSDAFSIEVFQFLRIDLTKPNSYSCFSIRVLWFSSKNMLPSSRLAVKAGEPKIQDHMREVSLSRRSFIWNQTRDYSPEENGLLNYNNYSVWLPFTRIFKIDNWWCIP